MNEITLSLIGVYNFISLLFGFIFHKIQSIEWQSYAVDALIVYSKIVTYVRSVHKYFYENNPFIRNGSDIIYYCGRFVYLSALDRRIEPFHYGWLSASSMRIIDNKYEFSEYFVPFTDSVDELLPLQYLKEWYKMTVSVMEYELNKDMDTVFTIKDGDYHFYRICNKNSNDIPTELSYEPSNIRFISIEVYMPTISTKPFSVELEKDAYIIDNVLFTPVFIKRLMEYNVNSTTFDINYKVVIMDNNINTVELTSSQYIVLQKEGYRIVSISDADNVSVKNSDAK